MNWVGTVKASKYILKRNFQGNGSAHERHWKAPEKV